jgi:hypothetical protein
MILDKFRKKNRWNRSSDSGDMDFRRWMWAMLLLLDKWNKSQGEREERKTKGREHTFLLVAPSAIASCESSTRTVILAKSSTPRAC